MNAEAEVFDYVIVGGGSAGSLIAARLTETEGVTVCVLEAGPADRNPFIHVPAGFIKTLFDPAITWPFQTEPSAWTRGRRIPATQGKTLGGSSSINGLVYNRGQSLDFDGWAQRGNPGWSYAEVLPYFKLSERRIGAGDERFRGREGAVAVTDPDWRHPVCEAFIAGVAGLGIPLNADYNGESQEGVGYFQRIIHGRWRVSAATAFLRPAMARHTLDVRVGTHVTAILCREGRAIGVRYARGGDRHSIVEVEARCEVILSAGTVNSAKLLQLSGIGPGDLLTGLGLPVVHELPGVGENFRDHYGVRRVARVKGVSTINDAARWPHLALEIGKWALGRPSILALSPSVVYVFCRSSPGLASPDLQFVFTPASYKQGFVAMLDDFPGMTCGVWQMRPESAGHVRICSNDPFESPVLQPNYLADPIDRRVIVDGLKLSSRFLRSAALAPYFEEEEPLGRAAAGDEELLEFAGERGSTGYHLIGTCRMGPRSDKLAVVDHELKVHGLAGLRIADASIMPTMPSANTYAATLMIAEKAADMIRGSSASRANG